MCDVLHLLGTDFDGSIQELFGVLPFDTGFLCQTCLHHVQESAHVLSRVQVLGETVGSEEVNKVKYTTCLMKTENGAAGRTSIKQ